MTQLHNTHDYLEKILNDIVFTQNQYTNQDYHHNKPWVIEDLDLYKSQS